PSNLTLHELFERSAQRHPESVALSWAGRALTYRELDERADRLAHRLAHRLAALEVGPEVRVGLCLERKPEMVVSLLAVLKAGGAYVPLDPSHPAERLAWIAADAGIRVLVADSASLAALHPDA